MKNKRLSLPIQLIARPLHHLASGEHVLLMQQLSERHRCWMGVFEILHQSSASVLLRSLNPRQKSSLEAWARRNNQEVHWNFILMREATTPVSFIQSCTKWLPAETVEQELLIATRKPEIFLRSADFSSVRSLRGRPLAAIRPDLLRHGWYVRASPGMHELVVENARNGLTHRLTLVVHNADKKTESKSTLRKQRILQKPFSVPGWD